MPIPFFLFLFIYFISLVEILVLENSLFLFEIAVLLNSVHFAMNPKADQFRSVEYVHCQLSNEIIFIITSI